METDTLISMSKISDAEKKRVEKQLKKILSSTYFRSAKQMRRFVEYIVNKTLSGEGRHLKQYTIGVEALDFPIDFDSDSNPSVRIMAGRVRKRLKEFYENTDGNEILITINKGSYIPEFSHYDSKKAIPKKQISNSETEISSGPSVALISFTDKSQTDTSNRLVVRITDVFAKLLSNFVLAKFAVFNPISDKSESYRLHREIKTDFKLNIYVQERIDKEHELICRLTDHSGEVHWSESFIIDPNLPLIKQEEMFEKLITVVVDTHQGRLYAHWARQLLRDKDTIPLKFQAAVFYKQFYDNLNIDTLKEAIDACQAAIKRDNDDIIAHILFSDLCRRDYVHCFDLIDSSLSLGIKSAERATHLKQDSHEAHFALAQLFFSQGNWNRSLEEITLARDLNRYNAVVEYASGFHLCLMDKWDEGLALVYRAIKMSNNHPSWYHLIISLSFYRKGDFKNAAIEAEKILSPGIAYGPLVRCIAYAQLGEMDKAKKELKAINERLPSNDTDGELMIKRFFVNKKLIAQVFEGLTIAMKG